MNEKVLTKTRPEQKLKPRLSDPILRDPIMIDSPQIIPVQNDLPRPLPDKRDIPKPELSDYADFRGVRTAKR